MGLQGVHNGIGIVEPTLNMRQEALAGRRQVVERAKFAEVKTEKLVASITSFSHHLHQVLLGVANIGCKECWGFPEVFEKLLRLCF